MRQLRTLKGIAAVGLSGLAPAEGVEGAATAWILVSTALVFLMTPALAFFYGGLVRSKNALNTMMMSFTALGFVGVGWALLGYSLAFAEGSAWLGGLAHTFLQGVGLEAKGSIPHLLFMAFQGTFLLLKLVGLLTPLRAAAKEEATGLDITQHGEEAYASGEGAILVLSESTPPALKPLGGKA